MKNFEVSQANAETSKKINNTPEMNWIAKSYPLPTYSKRTSQIIKLIDQSNSALDSWINFFLNESVFLGLNERENIDHLLKNLFEYTVLWRGYFSTLSIMASNSESKEAMEKISSVLNDNALYMKRNLYRSERGALLQLIRSPKNHSNYNKIFVKELGREVTVSGLMFLISAYNDFCLRVIKTEPKAIKTSLQPPSVSKKEIKILEAIQHSRSR